MMMLLPPGVCLEHYEDRHAAISLTVTFIYKHTHRHTHTHTHTRACTVGVLGHML